jgi:hypothetical protein
MKSKHYQEISAKQQDIQSNMLRYLFEDIMIKNTENVIVLQAYRRFVDIK